MTQPADDSIDLATVENVARLARLGLSPEECRAARGELAGLLVHFRAVQDADLGAEDAPDAERERSAGSTVAVTDVVEPFPEARATLLAAAPAAREGFIVVPRVLEDAPPAAAAGAAGDTREHDEGDPDPAGDE